MVMWSRRLVPYTRMPPPGGYCSGDTPYWWPRRGSGLHATRIVPVVAPS